MALRVTRGSENWVGPAMSVYRRLYQRAKAWTRTPKRPADRQARLDRGSVAVTVALTTVVLIGMVSLGVEVTWLLLKLRQMQSAADSAAMAGATALGASGPSGVTVEAQAVSAENGFVAGVKSVTVAVNNPPLSGSLAGNAGAVEVVITQPQTLALAQVIRKGVWNLHARAVATSGAGASSCALQLDASSTTGVQISNGATVNMNQCGLSVNALGGTALTVIGAGTLNASSVVVSGDTHVSNGGRINVTGQIKTGQPPTADPYANVQVPSNSGCKYGSAGHPFTIKWSASVQTIKPDGVYCGGLAIGNGARVVMTPGVYIIKGGTFDIGGGITLDGAGVTIVLTGSGSDYADVEIGNGATVNLSAPTAGATAGLVFFQDRKAPHSGTNNFNGGTQVTITGALYFPSQSVTYSNGTTSSSPCTQLVAWRLVFQGGASFNSNCANTGVGSIGASSSKLVE